MGAQPVIIKAQPDSRFILAFPVDQATIERPEDSDSLVFTFSDGGVVEIEGFYEQYTKDNLPEFEIEGQSIAGVDFFEAFAPDIEPAAGVGVSAKGGRYSNYGDADLMNGLRHLGDLDENFTLSYPDQVQTLDPVPFTVATSASGSGAAFPVAPTAPPTHVSAVPAAPHEPGIPDAPYVPPYIHPFTPPVTPPVPQTPPPPEERFIVSRDGEPVTKGAVLHNDGVSGARLTGILDSDGNLLTTAQLNAMNGGKGYETQFGYVAIAGDEVVYTAKAGVSAADSETFTYVAADPSGKSYLKTVDVAFVKDDNTFYTPNNNMDSYYSQNVDANNPAPRELYTGGGDDIIRVSAEESIVSGSDSAWIFTRGGDDIIKMSAGDFIASSGGSVVINVGEGKNSIEVSADGIVSNARLC